MALDHARKTLADRSAGHVHQLADLEQVDAELPADLQVGKQIGFDAKFLEDVARFDGGLGEVAGGRLANPAGAALAERHLHRGITVSLRRLDLGHAIVRHIHDSNRHGIAVIGKQSRHADLAAD